MLRQSSITKMLEDIDVLIASPKVTAYLVGFARDFQSRRTDYARPSVGIPHLYALAVQLDVGTALRVEEALFKACTANADTVRYKKYHREKRDKPYRRSRGGSPRSSADCAVYVACY